MYIVIKKIADKVAALLGLIILSPLFLLIVVAIKVSCGGPVIFRQKRVGIHKTYFNMYKFQTMRRDTPKDIPTHLLEEPHQYITAVGRFLRKSSLDELPQLINILRGEMSVVGPRPALWNQEDLIAEREKYGANDVLPGMTGLAQINGRDELSIEIKAALDGEYVKQMGLLTDLRCVLGTVVAVMRQKGVVEGGTGMKNANADKDGAESGASMTEKDADRETGCQKK